MRLLDRIFLLGDTHGNARWVREMCDLARFFGCSRMLQLGDFGIKKGERGSRFLDDCQAAAGRAGVEINAIPGNHEDYDEVLDLERRRDSDGFVTLRPSVRWIPRGIRWEWSGRRFGSIGGAYTTSAHRRTPRVDWWPAVEEASSADVLRLGGAPLDVLVTHDVPFGGEPEPIVSISREARSRSMDTRLLLRQAVGLTKPALVVHGHWHLRHTSEIIVHPDHRVVVEGLASDKRREGGWALLDLASLSVVSEAQGQAQAA